jgi:hypothetical protein
LKVGYGPLYGVKNFLIVEFNYHIGNCRYLPLRIEEKEQKNRQTPKEKDEGMRGFEAK